MPNRILREGILTSPKLCKLGWGEEVFYRRLMSVVDDFGRYYAEPGLLRAACYPRQLNKVSDSDIGKWLRACEDAALVRVYPAQDGERYLEVGNFCQQVRAKKSKFPSPDDSLINTCVADAKQMQSNEHLDVFVDVFVDEDVIGSEDASASRPSVPNCPHKKLLVIYGEELPTLAQPRIDLWEGQRADNMRQRWQWAFDKKRAEKRCTTEEEGIEFFRRFFAYVAKSSFLTGRNGKWNNCNLDWLMTAGNFTKVIEGVYEDRGGA